MICKHEQIARFTFWSTIANLPGAELYTLLYEYYEIMGTWVDQEIPHSSSFVGFIRNDNAFFNWGEEAAIRFGILISVQNSFANRRFFP
jgi:hypothetical protein